MPSPQHSPHIVRLPKSHPATLQHKYRALRLLALSTSPTSFASTHADDAATDEAGSAAPSMPTEERRLTGRLVGEEWLGMIVLVGPLTAGAEISAARSPWGEPIAGNDGVAGSDGVAASSASAAASAVASAAAAAASASGENAAPCSLPTLRYRLSGTFVVTAARNLGLGRRLVEAALLHARCAGRADGAERVCVTVVVEAENAAAVALYAGCGFVKVRQEVMMVKGKVFDGLEVPPREEVVWVMEWCG